MKTIVIANQKGGSGKSTVTVHLAVAAERAADGPILISDTDPQGSTADWFNQRKKGAGIHTPHYTTLNLADLKGSIKALDSAGAAYLFIDTAPSIANVNEQILAEADLILIPLNPTPTDVRALMKALPTIKGAEKPFEFVLTRVRPNLRNNNETAEALEAESLVLPARMHERVIYAESFAHGKTAFEFDPQGVAAVELSRLWRCTKKRIEERTKTRKKENQHEQA